MQNKVGNWIWIHDRALTTYKNGGVIYADGVFTDITERKRAEEEINDILEKVKSLLSEIIREDIKLKTVLTDKDCIVMADSDQIKHVLMNLVTNTKDAMPNGGLLTISTDVVELDDAFIKTHGYGEKGMCALSTINK